MNLREAPVSPYVWSPAQQQCGLGAHALESERCMLKFWIFYLLGKGSNMTGSQVPHLYNGNSTCLEGLDVEAAFMKCLPSTVLSSTQ